MEKETAVTNTNTLIFIAKLNIFNLAKNRFREIIITNEVKEELFIKESNENALIRKEIESANFLKEVKTKKIQSLMLENGEESAISCCLEGDIQIFLSEDKKARVIAESLGLKVNGVLGIILWNLQNKNINKEKAEDLLNKLKTYSYFFSANLYAELINLIRNYK